MIKAKHTTHKFSLDNGLELKKYGTILTILSKQSNKDGLVWVYLELTVNYVEVRTKKKTRVRNRFNTGVQIERKDWNPKKEETRDFETNSKLKRFRLEIEQHIEAIRGGEEFETVTDDIKTLQSLFASTRAKAKLKQKSILDYIDEYIIYRKSSGTPYGTLKEFTSLKNRLDAFQKATDEIITFESINLILSDRIIKYLSDDKYHPNTIKKTFEIFKTVLNYYYQRKDELGVQLSDKFKQKEFGAVKEYISDPIPLNDIEIELLRQFDFEKERLKELNDLEKEFKKGRADMHKKQFYLDNIEKRYIGLERTRKQVLLQLSTGLRVSDLFKIKPSNIKGQLIIMRPVKTLNVKEDNTIYIPLNAISLPILKELNYDSGKFKISSQNYNNNIKDLFKVIGLDEEIEVYEFTGIGTGKPVQYKKYQKLTSHNMRDTFISKAIRENVPIPVILRATGQSSYEVMKRYIKLDNQDMINHLGKLF